MSKIDNVLEKKITLKSINNNNIQNIPHNTEAEEIIIGSLLSNNDTLEMIENGLAEHHFFVPMLGRIYKAIYELINKDQIANPLTIEHYFADDVAFTWLGYVPIHI